MSRMSDCSEYRKLPTRPDEETRLLLPVGAAGHVGTDRRRAGCPQVGPSTSEVAMLHITSAMMLSSSFHASGFLNTPSSIRAP